MLVGKISGAIIMDARIPAKVPYFPIVTRISLKGQRRIVFEVETRFYVTPVPDRIRSPFFFINELQPRQLTFTGETRRAFRRLWSLSWLSRAGIDFATALVTCLFQERKKRDIRSEFGVTRTWSINVHIVKLRLLKMRRKS